MRKIALVTYDDHLNETSLNQYYRQEEIELCNYLNQEFKKSEVIFKLESWTDAKIDWKQYKTLILKAPWDYIDRFSEFTNWINSISAMGIPILNSAKTIMWNSDKHYLREIADAGLPVIPTVFLDSGFNHLINLASYFEKFGSSELILKPCVSGGSKHTYRISRESSKNLNVPELAEPMMIQPFMPEIISEGEWSFLFFGGKYSHALVKKTKPGDFRVQNAFGGTNHEAKPSNELVDQANKYIELFAKDCLYARVDGVLVQNQLMLMELELIEPFLFLDLHELSKQNYLDALLCKLPTLLSAI